MNFNQLYTTLVSQEADGDYEDHGQRYGNSGQSVSSGSRPNQ